jgi:ParB family chromosome partitioning protein
MAFHWGKLMRGKDTSAQVPASPSGKDDLDRRLAEAMPRTTMESECIAVRADDCIAWQGHPGDRETLTLQKCRPLIEAIAAQRGNTVPVKVRRTSAGSAQPYEVLVGHRRRFAVQWLNHNGRPEILLKVQLVEMTDEEVFRLVDVKYRDREDSCELDRARGYEVAVDRFYGGVQSRMAEALGFSNSQISRLLSLAQLPQEVVQAFATPDELRVRHAEVLTPLLRRPAQRALIVQAAIAVAHEQQMLALRHEAMVPAATVLARLKQAALAGDGDNGGLQMIHVEGICVGSVKSDRQGGVAIDLTVPPRMDLDILLRHVYQVIEDYRKVEPPLIDPRNDVLLE